MRRLRFVFGLMGLVGVLTLFVWQMPAVSGWLQPTAVLPTQAVTAEPVSIVSSPTTAPTLPATLTAVAPTATPTATEEAPTATPLPATNTPRPTAVPTEASTLLPTATAVPPLTAFGAPCPNPAPLKPAYATYTLGDSWPTPAPADAERLWLAKPLLGGGRYLINPTFPYGTDGNGRYLLHNGVDTAGQLGAPVLAPANGTVVVAQSDAERSFGWRCDWYGHAVMIELDATWQGQLVYAFYGHVLNLMVETGERVGAGQPVAEVGVGGAASAPHLHFEVRVGGPQASDTRNPMLWISPGETRGVIAGRLVDAAGRPWQGVGITLVPQVADPEFINTWSYMVDPLGIVSPNPDELLAENFVFPDVVAGDYIVYTKIGEQEYRAPVTVQAGQISTVEIVAGAAGE